MKIVTTVIVGALLAITVATPADAQRRHHRHGGGAFVGGLAAGAIVGGALASQPRYGYYDDGYAAYGSSYRSYGGGDEAVEYCMSRFRSYDPQSGTYLGNDGRRHSCP